MTLETHSVLRCCWVSAKHSTYTHVGFITTVQTSCPYPCFIDVETEAHRDVGDSEVMEQGFKAAVFDSVSIKAPWVLLTGSLLSDAWRKMAPAVVGGAAGPQLNLTLQEAFPIQMEIPSFFSAASPPLFPLSLPSHSTDRPTTVSKSMSSIFTPIRLIR